MPSLRREFLTRSTAMLASLAAFPGVVPAQQPSSSLPADDPTRPRLQLARVKEFVQAAHSDLARLKAMLAEEPALINASWDWGNGDWETALEGASHMSQMDTIAFLLQNGARANLFSLAVLGHVEAVTAVLEDAPALSSTRGPHFLTLLYHAALGGRVDLAEVVAARLGDDRAQHFNQALRGAAQLGTAGMVAWLLESGVTDVNERNFWDQTPLDVALERGHEPIISLLRKQGGVVSVPGTIRSGR